MKHNNLGTFSILFLVQGILTLAISLIFILYIVFGFFLYGRVGTENEDLFFNPGSFVIVFGLVFFVITVAFSVLTLLASKYLKHQKNYTFVFVMAIINCLTGILGIILGIFTLIELSKPEVKALFYKENELNSLGNPE